MFKPYAMQRYRPLLAFVLLNCLCTLTKAEPSTYYSYHISYNRFDLALSSEISGDNFTASVASHFKELTINTAQNECSTVSPVKIVVIGSSTAEGYGVKAEESWVGRYSQYLKNIDPDNEVVNLAKGGYNTYHLMPTGFSKSGRPDPDTERNITKAISLNPDGIIINLPSNDAANNYSAEEQMDNFEVMYSKAQEKGIPVWITTTQPRDKLNASQNAIQIAVRDAILDTYGVYALNFWTEITRIVDGQPKIKTEYGYGDSIHLNPEGHRVLFEEVKNKLVYERIIHLFTSIKSGTYSDESTWDLNAVPGSNAFITIKRGHTVSLANNISPQFLKVEDNGTLDLKSYQFTINCSYDIQGTLDAGQATVELIGVDDITLEGVTAIKTLKVNKSAGAIRLSNDLIVSGALELTKGSILLDGHGLTIEKPLSIEGGSASSYVQTTGQGDLIYRIDGNIINKALEFPVGDADHYTPFTFILKSGNVSKGKLSMKVVDSAPAEAGTADPLLSRYWDLRQEGMSDYLYNVKYQYLDEDVEGSSGQVEKDLKVIKYSNEDGWLIGGQVDANTNILFAEGINSFSIFSGGNNIEGAGALPVELIEFKAHPSEEGYALLQWKTASERNNDYFAIERSGNAEQWSSVAKVKGSGNSHDVVSYTFTDEFPLYGHSYYRLKQVDFDGQYEYSPIVPFYSDQPLTFNLTLVPNPAQTADELSLRLVIPEPEVKATVEVSDILGRMHYTEEFSLQNEHSALTVQNRLRPGLYLVTVRQGHRLIQKKLLVY